MDSILMPDPCARCERRMIWTTTWNAASPDERDIWRATGTVKHVGRGLCSGCYKMASRDGSIIDYPRSYRASADVLDDWRTISENMSHQLPMRRRIELAADRLGMTPNALRKTLDRAGVRSDWDGTRDHEAVAA